MTLFNNSKKCARTPVVLQSENAECGVIALSIIFSYYGRWVSIESLRIDCGVSRDGNNAASLVKVAQNHGLDAEGISIEDFADVDIDFPCIIHWKFNHFVVLEGIIGDTYYINDPASGRRQITKREFDKAFTGVVIRLKPNKDFQKQGSAPNWFKSLRVYLQDIKSTIALLCLLGLAMVIPGVLMPIMTRIFIDDVLGHYTSWLRPVLIAILILGLVQALIQLMQSQIMLVLQTRISIALNSRFIQQALEMPLSFFSQRSPAEMASRPVLISRLAQLISGPLGMSAIGFITAGIYLIVMFFFDAWLALGVLGIALINMLCFVWQSWNMQSINQMMVRERTQYAGASMQSLQLLPEIKANGGENILFNKLLGHKAKLLNQSNSLAMRKAFMNTLPAFMHTLSMALLLLIGGQRVMDGHMTIGVFVAFQGLMLQFMAPLQQILMLFNELQEVQGNIDKIEDISKQKKRVNIDWNYSKPEIKRLPPSLTITDLTFGYNPLKDPLLENFNLEVKEGKWIAIVGASGSGKSTIANLISGQHEQWSGTIHFGGKDISTLSSKTLHSSLAVVNQKIVLFNATVTENINMWNSSIDEEYIIEAAKAAQIHHWITHQPNGYDYKISENGNNLSGGEKARIEIARALAPNPSFIILDEATSSLDPLMEKEVLAGVRRHCQGGIIISHRIAAISNCDEILVFKEGQIVQRGTHEQLAKETGETYHQLLVEEKL